MARMLNGEGRSVSAVRGAMHSPPAGSPSMRGLSSAVLAFFVALPLALAACEKKEEAGPAPADIAAGKAVVEAQCVGCHGVDGRSVAPGIPDLAAQTERYLVASLDAYKEGTRTHAALHDLTAALTNAQIRDVAAYFASLPPLKPRAGAEQQAVVSPYDKGKAASQVCARCHGEFGNSTTAGIPSLAGQQPRYFISAVRAYLDGRRDIEGKEMLRELSHVDIEALALYYATQQPMKREAPPFGDPAAGEPESARCGGCHGVGGVSHDTSTPSLASQEPNYLVKAIKAYRDHTRQHSVMLDNNTDKEIEDLAAFYAVQESMPAEGAEITVQALAKKCDICHGVDAQQPALNVPKIAGQDRAYLINALRAYRDGKRGSSMMHNMSLPYSEAIIESVASLYASQPAR